ncbi:hypothetical protein ATCVGM07011_628L [Acanthocystis turfacea Chlorella virus GM0701.1]|nr:hypothetical protein ATCVGM07011_628L [Acanthocystis turfacea Chlorella virus GM0701.1]
MSIQSEFHVPVVPVTTRGMLKVPVHSLLKAILPCGLLLPAEVEKLFVGNEIPTVIECTIFHMPNCSIGVPVENLANIMRNIYNTALFLCANVVRFPDLALEQNSNVSLCHVINVQIRPHSPAVPVDGEVQGTGRTKNKFWDHFFWELMRAIHIVAARHDDRQLVRRVIGSCHHLCPSFGCCIWVCWLEGRVFIEAFFFAQTALAVYFIGRHVDEPPDTSIESRAFQENMGPVDVVHGKCQRVTERVVHMSLRSKVHNCVNFFLFQDVRQEIRRLDIALDELKIGSISNCCQVVQGRAVVHLVEHYHLALRVPLNEFHDDMGADETCSAGDKDGFQSVFHS